MFGNILCMFIPCIIIDIWGISQLRICRLPSLSFAPVLMKESQYAESNEK